MNLRYLKNKRKGHVVQAVKAYDESISWIFEEQSPTIANNRPITTIFLAQSDRSIAPTIQIATINREAPNNRSIDEFGALIVPKIMEMGIYTNGEFLEGLIKDTGFVDVQVKYAKLYNGTWAYGNSLRLCRI